MSAPTELMRNARTSQSPDGTTIVEIGGVEVHVRVKEDGRLYVWVEVDDEGAELIDPTTDCLPIVMGICETEVFVTDERGLELAR